MCSEPSDKNKNSRYFDNKKKEEFFAHNIDDPGPYSPKKNHQTTGLDSFTRKKKSKDKNDD